MRKNKIMRFASLILVLTLLSTSVISGTFAKYTTTAEGTDTARVANWGFEGTSTLDITNLFSPDYVTHTTGYDPKTVISKDGNDVIAPGTSGSALFQFAYDQSADDAPEVAYTFAVDTTGSTCEIADGTILWALDPTSDADYGTFAEMLDKIEALSGDASGEKTYDANNLPAAFSVNDDFHTIAWKWPYDGNDETDTALGNANDLADVTVSIKITATQID